MDGVWQTDELTGRRYRLEDVTAPGDGFGCRQWSAAGGLALVVRDVRDLQRALELEGAA
jgi:hypothetical protein